MKKRVFTAAQPSGHVHLGNYLGAFRQWASVQDDYDCIFGIVDLHAVTVYQDPEDLQKRTLEFAAILLACGIEPEKAHIMVQSMAPEHAELAWMLTCVTPIGWLQRMTQFKSKSEKQVEVTDGLLQYPVLMAADILLYNAAIVPVGDDQSQHLELTRDIAERFNRLYGETFVIPETKLPTVGARIMGLDDPTKKMSKSETGAGHAIGLLDAPDAARKKIMRATTDSQPHVDFEAMGPGVANLLTIHQALSGWSDDQVKAHFQGMRYGDLKKTVAETVVGFLEPFQERFRGFYSDRGELERTLHQGTEVARSIAAETIRITKRRMGLFS
ncbi:MAG: tryptophan--tRNA ligase [Fimbriimonadaceae bacterium]|nr:tryptophan--tRNA ligase [Fimbriimonadaceae bacterium]